MARWHRRELARTVVAGLWIAASTPVAGSERGTVSFESGTPQSAPGYVVSHAARYEAIFPAELAVRVSGPAGTKIRFVCATAGCEFPPSDQPDSVHRVDVRTFDVDSANGIASIKLTVTVPSPRTVVVVARPADGPRARTVRFALRMR